MMGDLSGSAYALWILYWQATSYDKAPHSNSAGRYGWCPNICPFMLRLTL